MLSVAPLSSGGPGYYLSLAENAAGYYVDKKGIEPAGIWHGDGARAFGLSGNVEAETLIRICRGYDPEHPEHRVRNADKETRKKGDDLCFSAPKSVSVAWALASDDLKDAMQRALHRATKDALDYIQDNCGLARVGAQGQTLERVPLAFALFEHASSRAGDPQLHLHVVTPNLTKHDDDRVTAIDSTHFYDHKMAAGALFRASLAHELERLGFSIEKDGFAFRIRGVDEDLCERFSQRRSEIVENLLAKLGATDAMSDIEKEQLLATATGRYASLVNLETRRRKEEHPRAVLFEQWRAIAREVGIEEHHVDRLLGPATVLSPEAKRAEKERLFEATLSKMTEQYSHFSKKDLVRALAEESQGLGLSAKDVCELVQNKLTSQELFPLGPLVTAEKNEKRNTWRERTEERFTTPEMLEMEGRLLGSVERLGGKSAAVPSPTVEAVLEKTDWLSEEQASAVRHLTGGSAVLCMTGKAGTGKSTTLDAARQVWEQDGKAVLGVALAGKASYELEKASGIESDTLARMVVRLENGRFRLSSRHVIVLDEAGMVSTKQMERLFDHVERAGAKVVLAGDAAQLQAIGAGGPFRSIVERVGDCQLTKVFRQRETWRRQTVEQLSRGEVKEALIAYVAQKQLHVTKTREEAISALVDRWRADNGIEKPQECLLLASLNAEVTQLNRKCQEVRRAAGKLGEERATLNGEDIHVGDRVALKKRDAKLGIENGFTGEVLSVSRESITVRLDDEGRSVTLALGNGKHHYGAKNLGLGYASTVHKAQGRTVDRCHVLMGGHMSDRHLAYVQMSRSRESTHLFIDQGHAGPELRDALRALSRDRTKFLARDILDRKLPEGITAEPPRPMTHQHSHGPELGR